ncbi:MAG: hypothetical protein ABGY71_12090 [bacterium]|jgi:hypothetical protein|nr:hypothetical protein [Planctomycetota bacterium]HIL51057.1 hypothetical protein [Planctomycetota bacterium]
MRTFLTTCTLLTLSVSATAQYRGLEWSIDSTHPVIDGIPRAVVRIYAGYDDPAMQLNAVYGDGANVLSISTSDPLGFYQSPFGGNTSQAINAALFPSFPDLRYDSWVTIGRDDSTNNEMLDIGFDYGPWNAGGSLTSDNAAWFAVPIAYLHMFPDANGQVLIAQLTVTLGETVQGTVHLQGKDAALAVTTHLDQTFLIQTGSGGVAFCTGDGAGGLACPCANSSTSGGCANSTGQGAILVSSGAASISLNNLTLIASGLDPSQPGLYFQGDNRIAGGAGILFGDGLRCAGGGIVRLQVRAASATGESATTASIATLGGVLPGDVKRYQLWYRNPVASPCGSGFNLSNGYELTWEF